MKTSDDFKRKLNDPEFFKLFSGVKSLEDVAQIAQQQGYSITAEDIVGTTLTDDILSSIAGGKGDVNTNNSNNTSSTDTGYVNITNSGSSTVAPTISPTVSPIINTKSSESNPSKSIGNALKGHN